MRGAFLLLLSFLKRAGFGSLSSLRLWFVIGFKRTILLRISIIHRVSMLALR
uniref:Uncharacterized protein n=1 Tax=Picea glauca TaxID=3330 RepID=A0A124GMS7_PICGL|nr:hypothetical protein ABT39_MTgene1308 [Picea glauca]